MTLLLGIDTGGTFTDAVLLEEIGGKAGSQTVIAKAKALTTHADLAFGIGEAMRRVFDVSGAAPQNVGLVSLSTTLATNALVEGQGSRICLIGIGFQPNDLERAGLAGALGDDPVVRLPGGHTTHGQEAAPLDMAGFESQLDRLAAEVSGFAVAGYFAVRNPAHELAVRNLLLEKTNLPVTCSHELSARLNGPRRALTTILNARLVPMIGRLIAATRSIIADLDITAPLMVVRGDGALVSADFAIRRPIETILSGPAASLVGASFLTCSQSAIVSDIGGTTSDVALLHKGRPLLDPDGARVGGYRTMVEAVAIHTFALGGDSEVGLSENAMHPEITLGPRRLVPVSLLASEHGTIVHDTLDKQSENSLPARHDGRFAMRSTMEPAVGLSANEEGLFTGIGNQPTPLETLLTGTSQIAALNRLVAKGLVMLSGLTPSDAMHVLGKHDAWDAAAAAKAARLFARRRDGAGRRIVENESALAERIVARVIRRSAEAVLETTMTGDGLNGAALISHPLIARALESVTDDDRLTRFSLTLDRLLVGLGASAHLYLADAAKLLRIEGQIPEHADVANAIGAVVGQVEMRAEISLSQPSEGHFTIHGADDSFTSEKDAFAKAEKLAQEDVEQLAHDAGAGEIEIFLSRDCKIVEIESRPMFVEGKVIARAIGRPPIA